MWTRKWFFKAPWPSNTKLLALINNFQNFMFQGKPSLRPSTVQQACGAGRISLLCINQMLLTLYPCWAADTFLLLICITIWADTAVTLKPSLMQWPFYGSVLQKQTRDNNRPCQSSGVHQQQSHFVSVSLSPPFLFLLSSENIMKSEVSRCFLVSQNEQCYTSLPLLLPAEVCPTQKRRRGVCAWGVIWNLNMW